MTENDDGTFEVGMSQYNPCYLS